jgi:pimeloyl-ACP methyl ester carboxylesterase
VKLLFSLLCQALLLCSSALAQEFEYSRSGTIPLKTARSEQSRIMPGLPSAGSPIDFYKISYLSTNLKGAPTSLSGLVLVPQGGAPNGLIVYFHGTTSDRRQSPSRFSGWGSNLEVQVVALAFASGGYAVAMPDYLGLGDNEGVHPYLVADTNSRSGIDVIEPARSLCSQVGVSLGKRLLITGYSEGGAVAMWAVRHLEETPGERPDMAAPMSGPYDLGGVTARSILTEPESMEGLAIRLFLLGVAGYSALNNVDGIDLNNYFAPSFASYVRKVLPMGLDDESVAAKLLIKGVQEGAFLSVRRVLTRHFCRSLATSDTRDPFIAQMARNDCYDWEPHTPMLLPYLTTDSVVPPANTLEAIEAMRARFVAPDLVRAYPIVNPSLDHITAVLPALVAARRFFDSGIGN